MSDNLPDLAMKTLDEPMTCMGCRELLDGRLYDVLAQGSIPTDDPVFIHIQSCIACGRVYVDLLDTALEPEVSRLGDMLVTGWQKEDPKWVNGLLSLWQLQVAVCERLEDLRSSSYGLSVIGMLRRALAFMELHEAEDVHNLALETAGLSGDPDGLTAAISHSDLGYLAKSRGDNALARDHLEKALASATAVSDAETAARVVEILGSIQSPPKTELVSKPPLILVTGPATLPVRRLAYRTSAAGSQNRMLVLNGDSGEELGFTIIGGLRVDANRKLRLHIRLNDEGIEDKLRDLLGEKRFGDKPFYIDVVYLGKGGPLVLTSEEITLKKRSPLMRYDGLEMQAQLPGPLPSWATEPNAEYELARSAIAFRMWWQADKSIS